MSVLKWEAQFLIKRNCIEAWSPLALSLGVPEHWPNLPLCVWVELEEFHVLPCGGKSYHVLLDRDAVNMDGELFEVTASLGASRAHVCEHMGQVIE